MLTAQSINKRFGNITALNNLSLNVAPGEAVCLLGANGAGKTTTLNLFLGFMFPDSGEIRIAEQDPFQQPAAARQHMGYIPENVALYPRLSGLENLGFFDRIAGGKKSTGELRDLLKSFGLSDSQIQQRVGTYSKGMRQKVGLAIAFAKGAKALLLDEPMSGLDPKAASEFTVRLDGFKQSGCAVLMATHDIFRAKECATRIGIMKSGNLVEMIDAEAVGAAEIERIYLEHMHEESNS